ncbi:MAG: bifunctional nuclease domain-containing protein [Myxococcota bacterium]
MLIEMKVAGLIVDGSNNVPLLILKDDGDRHCVPIVIGLPEARAIVSVLQEETYPRPLTHDLLRSVIETMGSKVEKVEVTDLRDDTFFAAIHVSARGETRVVDSRPSDAIALALRARAPIFVDERVIEKLGGESRLSKPAFTGEDKKKWTELLENLRPEDFGKYKI